MASALLSGTMFRSHARRGDGGQARICPLEQIHKLTIAPGDLRNGLITGRAFAPPGDQRLPEDRAADRKSDEPGYSRRDPEPLTYFPIVLAATENDAADIMAATGARRRHDALAILGTCEPLDLP